MFKTQLQNLAHQNLSSLQNLRSERLWWQVTGEGFQHRKAASTVLLLMICGWELRE